LPYRTVTLIIRVIKLKVDLFFILLKINYLFLECCMKSNDFTGMSCPIAKLTQLLHDRWGMLIMRDLLLGLRRYDELKQSSNITHATLSQRLKVLQTHALIEKKLYQQRPARYEYWPTRKGQTIAALFVQMLQLGNQLDAEQDLAPQLLAVDANDLAPVHCVLINSHTQQPIDLAQVRLIAGPAADQQTLWRLAQAAQHGSAST
jgi:DNA-binding HxlR family transcriptional regulator